MTIICIYHLWLTCDKVNDEKKIMRKKIVADKILYFTDIHFGVRSDSLLRLEICKKVVDQIIDTIKKNDIKYVIFGGDLFHSRVSLNVNTLNVAIDAIKSIAKYAHIYMIIGNHDIHYKNSLDVHSMKLFNDLKNIDVIEEPTELMINDDKKMLLVPWMSDLDDYKEESYDYIVGHFDISAKYLIASYIEEHSKDGQKPNVDSVLNELINNELGITGITTDTSKSDINEILEKKQKTSSKYIGNFINLCKKNGTILAGHIHTHKDFKVKGRRFIFIGSPQQQNFGDRGSENGYYVHDLKSNRYSFIKTTDIPVHKELMLSMIDDTYDFNECAGNYIKLIIDKQIDHNEYSEILNKINCAAPAEIFPPEYHITLSFNNDVSDEDINEHAKKIKQSKTDYIYDYIDSINDTELKPNEIDKDILYGVVMTYYDNVKEETSEGATI